MMEEEKMPRGKMKVVYVAPNEKDAQGYAKLLQEAGLKTKIKQEGEKFMVYSDGKIVMVPKAVRF